MMSAVPCSMLFKTTTTAILALIAFHETSGATAFVVSLPRSNDNKHLQYHHRRRHHHHHPTDTLHGPRQMSSSLLENSKDKDDNLDLIQQIGGPRAHVYGEMTPNGFSSLASALKLSPDDVFLDLGSGHGDLVLQAAQEFDVSQSMGIELSVSRHERALQTWNRLSRNEQPPQTQTTPQIHPLTSNATSDRASSLQSTPHWTQRVTLVCGDAAGDEAARMLQRSSFVWCSNLLFDDTFNRQLAQQISTQGHSKVRVVASLKEFPGGIAGFELHPQAWPVEMSWTVANEYHTQRQPGHPPLPGHPCCIYWKKDN